MSKIKRVWGMDLKGLKAEPKPRVRPMWAKVLVRTLVVLTGMIVFGYLVGIIEGRW